MQDESLEQECVRLLRQVQLLAKQYAQKNKECLRLEADKKALATRLIEVETQLKAFQNQKSIRIIADNANTKSKSTNIKGVLEGVGTKDQARALLDLHIARIDRLMNYLKHH